LGLTASVATKFVMMTIAENGMGSRAENGLGSLAGTGISLVSIELAAEYQ